MEETIAIVFVLLAGIFSWGFIIHYTITLNWWKTIVGIQLFLSSFSIASLVTLAFIRRFFGPFDGYGILSIFVYITIATSKGILWGTFIHTRKVAKHKQELQDRIIEALKLGEK